MDFLQKCEAASVKRIEELEAIERDLHEQLATKSDPKCQREINKIQELKHQITFLETDNKALSARVAELEENEETLRENWRRVADEDFNRTQSLEEKVPRLLRNYIIIERIRVLFENFKKKLVIIFKEVKQCL